MYYAPHTLVKKTKGESLDEYGRVVGTSEEWTKVCPCRCDDNTVQEFYDENGHVFRPKYHIVASGVADVMAGDEVRVLTDKGEVRGSGTVYNVKKLNVLPYTDIWV